MIVRKATCSSRASRLGVLGQRCDRVIPASSLRPKALQLSSGSWPDEWQALRRDLPALGSHPRRIRPLSSKVDVGDIRVRNRQPRGEDMQSK